MITQKPISGVAFLPIGDLLDRLATAKNIDYWFAIEHLPEGDEGHKLHCHFFLVPDGRVDTKTLRRHIGEHCLPLRSSKESDWILYALHDPEYLVSHCLTKERNYSLADIQTNLKNSQVALQAIYSQSKEGIVSAYSRITMVKKMAAKGLDWSTVLSSGIIPPQQFPFYKELFTQFFSQKP